MIVVVFAARSVYTGKVNRLIIPFIYFYPLKFTNVGYYYNRF